MEYKSYRNLKIIIVTTLIIIITFFGCIKLNYAKASKDNKEKIIYKEIKPKKIDDIRKYENIVFLGDSITEYYPIDDIYLDLPIVKSGVAGYTTNDILERMEEMVYQYNPTSVFLLIGTNDIMYNGEYDIDEVTNNVIKILKNIKENRKSAKIYVESIYPVNRNLEEKMVKDRKNNVIKEINDKIKEFSSSNGITYIDMYDALSDSNGNFDKKYTNDGLHPNDLGYAKISQVRFAHIYNIEM